MCPTPVPQNGGHVHGRLASPSHYNKAMSDASPIDLSNQFLIAMPGMVDPNFAGAVIYVCGSLEGMASGVHAALETALGADVLLQMLEDGRYRRDVY